MAKDGQCPECGGRCSPGAFRCHYCHADKLRHGGYATKRELLLLRDNQRLSAKVALCDEMADVVRNYRKHIERMIEALDAAKSAFEALKKGDGSECESASAMVDDDLAGAFDQAEGLDEFLSEYDALEASRG